MASGKSLEDKFEDERRDILKRADEQDQARQKQINNQVEAISRLKEANSDLKVELIGLRSCFAVLLDRTITHEIKILESELKVADHTKLNVIQGNGSITIRSDA